MKFIITDISQEENMSLQSYPLRNTSYLIVFHVLCFREH